MRAPSLSAQLRRRVTAVVAVLALLISVGTIVAARAILYTQLDGQLNEAVVLQARGDGSSDYFVPGMPPGTIIALQGPDGVPRGSRIGSGQVDALSTEAYDVLVAVPRDGRKHSVDVPGYGQYRVEASSGPHGTLTVIAIPLEHVHSMLLQLSLLALVLGVVAVAVAAVATRAVANAATRPLRALSRTAAAVSELHLDRGQVTVSTPVPDPGLHPNHEVATLTYAFNRMLGNIDSALAARHASEMKLRRFVADASHELRNPLAAIRGYSELAARSQGQDSAFALGRIDAESQRMTKLVEDLLLLARLDADAPVAMGAVDIVEVVLNAVSDAQAAGPDHVWRLELPEEGFEVRANSDRLHQVIVNLLSNARNHTPAGTTVTTSVARVAGRARLTVADDGPGIAPDVLPTVFERFTRADASRQHSETKSTGLGLSIVQAVVTSFGGTTEVTSRPGETRFTVWLPLA